MVKRKEQTYNCIALYDWTPESTDLKGWFHYMEEWAHDINISWDSIGLGISKKLLLFKNGKRKIEKLNFQGVPHVLLTGGVDEPGTYTNWKIDAFISNQSKKSESYLCFDNNLAPFTFEVLTGFLRKLLSFADFKYGICYQRSNLYGPSSYAGGTIEIYGDLELPYDEEKKIGNWMRKYTFDNGYRTGLLRDVYPFSILVDQHLSESVGNKSFKEWVESDPTHGSLTKITADHYLWAVDPIHIPLVQETLQQAGFLLCYKV